MQKCPQCQSKNINKNGQTASGNQSYICKHCGKRFSDGGLSFGHKRGKRKSTWQKYTSLDCPQCQSKDIKKNGRGRLNHQRYKCKFCGKTFSDNPNIGRPISN